VLTAAHCVWSRRHYPAEVNFLSGFHQSSYVARSKAKSIHVCEAFESGKPSQNTFSADWAIIELEKPIGKKAGYVGLADFDAKVFERMDKEQVTFKVSGYRGDRVFVQTVDHDCRLDGFTSDEKLMLHRCPIIGGDSGGSLLLPVQGELLVVGIDVGTFGKTDWFLKRGEERLGFAVPSSSFRDKLIELGFDIDTLEGTSDLVGHLGWNPRTSKD
jgi:V8-like Glu-specific endopeptidase